jgi:hypothetical protein
MREMTQVMTDDELAAEIMRLMSVVAQQMRAKEHKNAACTQHRLYELQGLLARRFGEHNGWRLTETAFSLATLARGKRHSGSRRDEAGRGYFPGEISRCFDHPEWFRYPDGRAAAIIAQLYSWPEIRPECEAVASRYGLELEASSFPCWHLPDAGTTLVVYRSSTIPRRAGAAAVAVA